MTEETNEPDISEPDEADWIKQLRKDAAEAKKLRSEVTTLRRTTAMDNLGIPKTGAGKLFRKTWDGDPEDFEALKAAAAEYELIPTANTSDPTDVADALDASDRIADTTSGGGPADLTVETLLADANSLDEIERIARDAGFAVSQA